MDPNSLDFDKMDVAQIQDTLQRVNFAAGKQAEDALKTIMSHAINKGIMPKAALKISDDTMEAIYTQAYNLYNQGKYKEASYIFRLLMLLDYTTSKYVLGVAASLHRMKDYTNAANLYLLCSALDTKNPMPHYHSADCYLQLNAVELAVIALNMAITAAGDQPQYAVLKERAQLLKAGLDVQIKERAEKIFGKKEEEAKKTTT